LEAAVLRHLTHRFTLILTFLIGPAFGRIAAAAAPHFEGTFTSPSLCSARGIALSPSGDVFVGSDCGGPGHHMEHFTAAGALVGTWGFLLSGYLGPPNGVALDALGRVFVTDCDGNHVDKYSSSGALLGGIRTASGPVDVAVNASGEVLVAALYGPQVQKFSSNGSLLATIGSAGDGPGQYQSPHGITVDASGRIYVADGDRRRILRFLADGSFDMEFATEIGPDDVGVGPDGTIYVVGFYSGTVYQYSSSGALLLSFTSPLGLYEPYRIAISPDGVIFITEQESRTRITKFQIDLATPAMRTTFGRLKAIYR
jgi:sugar lactone lactonase YvrE